MPANDDRDARYAEILRNLAKRKLQTASAPIQSVLSAALDALNAAGLLAAIKRRPPKGFSAYGPKTFSGSFQSSNAGIPDLWVGSVMWHKPKGYQYYQTLNLLGVWALGSSRDTRIVIGEKVMQFNAPVFNPESYYHHIKRKFDLHYSGNASPPVNAEAGNLIYDVIYNEAQRLEMRKALEGTLRSWVAAQKDPSPEE